MKEYNLYWGDFHKHLADIERADEIIEFAKYHLDVYPVLCYPFRWERIKGARIETVRQRPEFLEWWKNLQEAARKHHKEGRFVTFLGYEWHGNRTLYGDHNVIYYHEDNPLDDSWELEELYENLRKRKAYAIPHHTAYMKRHRGKNWDIYDPTLSPVTEIYSSHGSSEGVGTSFGLLQNVSMGPRNSGGTFIDALNRGYRIGVIASNDGAGLPGSWSKGVAGIWAEELTKDSIWEAIGKRRTIAATGDRISLWFTINEHPMGTVLKKDENDLEARIQIQCSQPLDRIELVHNGKVKETYSHKDKWEIKSQGRFKILTEFGWGPATHYGFKDVQQSWAGEFEVKNGKLLGVEPRFDGLGQRYEKKDQNRCSFQLTTSRRGGVGFRQGLVFELKGNENSNLHIRVDDHEFQISLKDSFSKVHLFPFLEESIKRVQSVFGLKKEEVENPDIYYHNARKLKVHPSYPKEAYEVDLVLKELPKEKGQNYYYLRAYQIDGQMAWSSPIWMKNSH